MSMDSPYKTEIDAFAKLYKFNQNQQVNNLTTIQISRSTCDCTLAAQFCGYLNAHYLGRPDQPQSFPDEECVICKEKLVNQVVTLTSCPHRFHRACLNRWQLFDDEDEDDDDNEEDNNHRLCPTCRTTIHRRGPRFHFNGEYILTPSGDRIEFETNR